MTKFTFSPLTPTDFLNRAAWVFGDRVAVVDGQRRFTYREFAKRSRQLAGALAGLGVTPGDRVAALCTNSHIMLEMHYGVPLAGAVLVPLNIRLSVDELLYIVKHAGANVLVVTAELVSQARELAEGTGDLQVVVAGGTNDDYESLIEAAKSLAVPCTDERGLLAINYTSGTTGRPKGVMYHHRGAYLQALAMAFHSRLSSGSRYLWILPMFHCDGWCFPWAVCAAGGTQVCLRATDVEEIWRILQSEDITHFSAAPTVLSMIANAKAARGGALTKRRIRVDTGGAPPSPALLARMATLRMDVNHLYGLTETFGPVGVNDWQPEWDALAHVRQADLKARQGVGNIVAERIRAVDEQGNDVPEDATTIGELVVRGNNVMLGYYRDEESTAAVNMDGWLRTGDLGVVHPDGYIEIRDRRKDIIISGGENIASVEVERALDSHPAVLESAVVGERHAKWGEVPVAYVTLREGWRAEPIELIQHVRERLATFKSPQRIVFTELPKTSTGKIQKNVLRSRLQEQESGDS